DRLFPDVNVRARSSRAYSNFTIRGQSSVDFYNPTVQVYVDGLPQDQTTFSQLLPQNLDRVELLYGPQGTLYGRGAVGG
ncbi:Plug domain-containing protein, partial [Vibrio parahaemolyticus]